VIFPGTKAADIPRTRSARGSGFVVARRCPRPLFLVSVAIAPETRNKAKTLGGKTAYPGHPGWGCGAQLL
jgi:hypothetical protein